MARQRTAPPLAVLFLLLLSTAARPSQAQSSNTTVTHHSAVGGFTPTTVIVLVVLISAFVILTLFSIYINRCAPTRAPPPRRPPSRYAPPDHHQAAAAVIGGGIVNPERRARAGLDREVVESFPTAVYGDVKARVAAKSGGPTLECAVCLAAFEDIDELRVLPACFHVFHPGCIDPWLAGAVTCPLCRADLTATAPYAPAGSSSSSSSAEGSDLAAPRQEAAVREQTDDDEERDDARLVAAFTPESVMSFGAARPHEFHYRRTQSAMDVPDRHTLRLPEHVMKELAAVRRHRRAASLAGYPDGGAERTPGWLASFWRSVSWQRPSRTDQDAFDEHGGSNGKRVVPVTGTPAERPSGSGAATDDKEKPDHDALNQV